MNALEIKGLCKTYKPGRGKAVSALNDLHLAVGTGEVFGFLGPNGAGKSTTIKIVMGLIMATKGEVVVGGLPVRDPAARSRIGYLPENPNFYDFLTGREYLSFIGASFGMKGDDIASKSKQVLEKMELMHAADRPIRGYSKGMVQRLGLAQALLHDPEVFILDEPMSGLDPLGRALVKNLIKELKQQGKTVFFSTHITADVEAVCDRVGVIVKGELRAVDKVENILEKGIEGYNIHLRPTGETAPFPGFDFSQREGGAVEYHVPRPLFKEFMEMVLSAQCEVDLIEPVRKDIETFFLDIVRRG